MIGLSLLCASATGSCSPPPASRTGVPWVFKLEFKRQRRGLQANHRVLIALTILQVCIANSRCYGRSKQVSKSIVSGIFPTLQTRQCLGGCFSVITSLPSQDQGTRVPVSSPSKSLVLNSRPRDDDYTPLTFVGLATPTRAAPRNLVQTHSPRYCGCCNYLSGMEGTGFGHSMEGCKPGQLTERPCSH